MTPWEFSPSLTRERLICIADILRRARDSAARDARPHLGDTLFNIGLTAYERAVHALALAAKNEHVEWLSTQPMDGHFAIIFGRAIVARFYRGDADAPIPEKTLRVGPEERAQTRLALEPTGMAGLIQCVRLEVEKKDKGFTKGVNFVWVDHEGERFASWPIPRFVSADRKRGAVKLNPINLDAPDENRRADASGA